MKILKLLFLFTSVNCNKIIKNENIQSCRNCVHFKPSLKVLDDDFSSFGKCDKFGSKDIISGKITDYYADYCRNNEDKCGHDGKYWEIEKNLDLKILKHKIYSNWPLILVVEIVYILSHPLKY